MRPRRGPLLSSFPLIGPRRSFGPSGGSLEALRAHLAPLSTFFLEQSRDVLVMNGLAG
jgi:hypothetical protein